MPLVSLSFPCQSLSPGMPFMCFSCPLLCYDQKTDPETAKNAFSQALKMSNQTI
jgi:hypothetical protein